MGDERAEFGFKRIVCACSTCLRNCYCLPGYLTPADLQRLADYLGEDDIVCFALDNLLASPGALVVAYGEIFAIPTIVSARRQDGVCRFLKNDLCSIHAVNPFGWAFFSAEQTKEQSDSNNFDCTKASIGFRTQSVLATVGTAGVTTVEKPTRYECSQDQCW
jgi:hypothetical protein